VAVGTGVGWEVLLTDSVWTGTLSVAEDGVTGAHAPRKKNSEQNFKN